MKLKHPTHFLDSKPALAWSLAALYAILIFILSSFPYGPPEPGFTARISSTYKHVMEYAVFGFLLLAALRSNEKTRGFALFLAFALASFYGATDEFHQMFVPNRIASLYDVVADSIGGFLGAFFMNPGTFRFGKF